MAELDILGTLSQLMQRDNTSNAYGFPEGAMQSMEENREALNPTGGGIISQALPDLPDPGNPYGFPEASVTEMERTRELLNPEGKGVITEAAPQIAEALQEVGVDLPQALGEIKEELPAAMGQVTEELPQALNISNQEEVQEIANTEVMAKAKKAGEIAQEKGKEVIEGGSKAENFDLWNMVKSAGQQVGDVMEIGFDAWMDLSPSTKVALIGSAATAYAYKRGWEKTAGDVAKTSAGMYLNMYGKEQDLDVQQSKNLAELIKNGNKPVKADYTESDRVALSSQMTNLLRDTDKYKALFGNKDELKQEDVDKIISQYLKDTQGNRALMTQTPLIEWLKAKQEISDAAKLQESREAKTHTAPGYSVGGTLN